ncbi:MAG TPA: hypothetical protein VEN79_03460 [Terriglobia bacterium]|nr:hypothetical protein [Terriglobia bacterium]
MLFLRDPDGLQLELISSSNANPDHIWERGPVPSEHAIRGFHHVTLSERGHERTASLLTETLGFRQIAKDAHTASAMRERRARPARLDPIVPSGQVEELGAFFESGGADVTISWRHGGHELGEDDVRAARTWLSQDNVRKRVAA